MEFVKAIFEGSRQNTVSNGLPRSLKTRLASSLTFWIVRRPPGALPIPPCRRWTLCQLPLFVYLYKRSLRQTTTKKCWKAQRPKRIGQLWASWCISRDTVLTCIMRQSLWQWRVPRRQRVTWDVWNEFCATFKACETCSWNWFGLEKNWRNWLAGMMDRRPRRKTEVDYWWSGDAWRCVRGWLVSNT